MSLRLPKDEERYQLARKEGKLCGLLALTPIRDFNYWFIAKNDFHHSKISDEGDMLILKRKAPFHELHATEYFELFSLINRLNGEGHYHKIELNFSNTQSVPDIVHFHLQVLKDEMRS
jgi:hypothetical protein